MHRRFADAAFDARKMAGLSVERAAECLSISPRTLNYYEAGRATPDEIVARMVGTYQSPELGYYWLSKELFTGRLILPEIDPAGISSKALRLRLSMRRAAAVQEELEEICADDAITANEKKPLARCIGKIRELAAACMNISLLERLMEHKEKTALIGGQHGITTEKMI